MLVHVHMQMGALAALAALIVFGVSAIFSASKSESAE